MTTLAKICLVVSLFACGFDVKGNETLKGKVVVIDHKWGFMVLNIGLKDGLQKDKEMNVSSAGKLIGRIKITRVEETVSIAETIKGWQLYEVVEGDDVSNSK